MPSLEIAYAGPILEMHYGWVVISLRDAGEGHVQHNLQALAQQARTTLQLPPAPWSWICWMGFLGPSSTQARTTLHSFCAISASPLCIHICPICGRPLVHYVAEDTQCKPEVPFFMQHKPLELCFKVCRGAAPRLAQSAVLYTTAQDASTKPTMSEFSRLQICCTDMSTLATYRLTSETLESPGLAESLMAKPGRPSLLMPAGPGTAYKSLYEFDNSTLTCLQVDLIPGQR